MSASVLQEVRALDFGRFIAAPCCAAIMADLGADVIRIERIGGGEDRWLGPISESGEGGMFLQNNRNKRSLSLDPMRDKGREVVRRLVAEADVVVANLPDKQMAAMGISYDQLRAIKPDAILTLVTAYGRGGPYSDRLGFDAVGQVMSGAVRTTAPYVDFSTALSLAIGTLAALMHRNAGGEGQVVEASLLNTSLMMTSAMLIEQAVVEANREATLNRGQQSAPNNIYAISNSFILVQVVGQPIFKRWAALMGGDWLDDPRFANDMLRGDNWEVVDGRMAEWCLERTKEQALAELEAARIPAYPVNTIQDALDDPHIAVMGYLTPTDYPGLPKPAPIVQAPYRLSGTPLLQPMRAPTPGEHTAAILRALGYAPDEIEGLRDEGVI